MLLPRSLPWEQYSLAIEGAPPAEIGTHTPSFKVPKWIYLSTLTFANPEPAYDVARDRWRSFQSWLDRHEKWGVCAPEYGEETGRLHFHLVHVERWSAAEMWGILPRYGFGRYDVRRRPAWLIPPSPGNAGQLHPAAWYLAKYVGKRHHWPDELKGSRQWSVFGEKHFPFPVCKVRDVKITTKCFTVASESPIPFHDSYGWHVPSLNLTIRQTVRPDAPSNGGIIIMRELTAEQIKKVVALQAAGDIVGVGEYRFCGIERKEMDQWKDGKKTGNKETRIIVTHKVDFGTTFERREFDDLLAAGTDEKSFTAPAKSGDLVAVCVDSMRAFQGGTNFKGRIVKL